MYQLRSLTTGEVLGVAPTEESAREMADRNGWANWSSESLPVHLELSEPVRSYDPRNMRGKNVPQER